MKKFFALLSSVVISVVMIVSCNNGLNTSSSEYGSLVVTSGSATRAIDTSTLTSATVTVSGYGMNDVKVENVSIVSGKNSGEIKIENIKAGTNRVVTVTSNVTGAVIRNIVDIRAGETSDCEVNWATTSVANVYYNLIKSGTDVSALSAATFENKIPAVHASLFDAESFATDLKAASLVATGLASDDYILVYGNVKVNYTNVNGYTVQVTDLASEKTTFTQDSGNVTLKGYPGTWKVKVYDDGGTLKETKDVIVASGKDTTITVEYGEGVDFSDKTIIFVKATSAPYIWAWEQDGVALTETAGGSWPNSSSATKMVAATSGYMADPSGWYMIDYTTYATGKTIEFKLNWSDPQITGEAGTFWYDSTASSPSPTTTNPSPVVSGLVVTVENPQVPVAPTAIISPASGDISVNDSITITLTNGNDTISAASVTVTGEVSRTYTYSDFTNNVLTIKVSDLGIEDADKTIIVNASVTNSVGTATADQRSYTTTAPTPVADTFCWDNANVYFVIQDRFYDGDSTNNNSYGRMSTDDLGKNIGTFHGGDIKGLTQKLDYIEDLGINAIWITAPYEQAHGWCGGGDPGDFAHYGYHGYYPLDYTMMDKNMGTVEEFRSFVTECHKRGIRVVMDVVMNHTGYLTLQDCQDYSIDIFSSSYTGGKSTDMGFKIGSDGDNYQAHHNKIDYSGHNDGWAKWWGNSWVRAGVPGYTAGGSDELTQNLNNLPDVKTDNSTAQTVAPILQTKWAKETTGYSDWIVPAASSLRSTSATNAPVVWIEKWLTAWVEEFGIDGFRCDTAKHVDYYRWGELKALCKTALATWRASDRADEYAKDWDEDFWMVGEAFNHTYSNNMYGSLYSNGFDALIDFTVASTSKMGTYSPTLPSWSDRTGKHNCMLYISSHDTGLGRWSDQKSLGTQFILTPGPIQIYYGDETSRVFGETGSDGDQGTRSDMNWSASTGDCAKHWGKLGTFRKFNPAVGAGSISGNTRTYNDNQVVISTSSTTVSVPYDNGTTVYNWYDGTSATVSGGSVTFSSSSASTTAPVLCSDRNPADYGVTF